GLEGRAPLRREPAGDDRARPLRPRARVARRARLRDARGHPGDLARRAAAPRVARLRGRGRRQDAGPGDRYAARADRRAVMSAVPAERSPARIGLGDLLRLKAAGESIRLATPSVRAAAAGGHLSPFKGRGIEYD